MNLKNIAFAALSLGLSLNLGTFAFGAERKALYTDNFTDDYIDSFTGNFTVQTTVSGDRGALMMPGVQAEAGFSELTAPDVYTNKLAGVSFVVPTGYNCDLGSDIYYSLDDALSRFGYATDIIINSALITAEEPDPETATDNAALIMGFFVSPKKTDGSDRDINAYMLALIERLSKNPKLTPYVKQSMERLGNQDYLCYKLDYTEALQTYYHIVYAKYDEHPAFYEEFPFKVELYCRNLGDKLYMILYLKTGEKFESLGDLTSYIK